MSDQPTPRATPLELVPLNLESAKEFCLRHHRHHLPSVSHKFSIGAAANGEIVGVVTVGRPVARGFDNGWTLEVTRLTTIEDAKNAASMLYAAAWRATKALGYRRLITYTLVTESGTSLRAAGWKVVGEVAGRSWSCKSRPRVDKHPTLDKRCWEAA